MYFVLLSLAQLVRDREKMMNSKITKICLLYPSDAADE